ncbi:flagellar basal body rod C-terminal domain-containing protein [Enterococcus bulliens]
MENSTVDLAKEMTDLIVLQRIYGMNTKAVQTADELWQVANRFTE